MDVGNCELQFSVISDSENSEACNRLAQPISEVRNTVNETRRASKCSQAGLLDVVIFCYGSATAGWWMLSAK